MKISGQEALRSYSLAQASRSTTAVLESETPDNGVQASSVPAAVKSSISSQARDIQVVKDALSQLPDVREDRVSQLKSQYESGQYQVSSDDIADLIIRRALADSTSL